MICPTLRWARAGSAMALLLTVTGAHAEPTQAAPETVTLLAYPSALAAYKSYAEQPVSSWREANDTVGRIGGWRSYAREAAQEGSSAVLATDTSAPATAGQDDNHGAVAGRP